MSLKNPILRDKCWVKGNIALLRKLAILGRRWIHVPKKQLPLADQGARGFKGEFHGYIGRAGGYMQNSTVNSDNHLDIGHAEV